MWYGRVPSGHVVGRGGDKNLKKISSIDNWAVGFQLKGFLV